MCLVSTYEIEKVNAMLSSYPWVQDEFFPHSFVVTLRVMLWVLQLLCLYGFGAVVQQSKIHMNVYAKVQLGMTIGLIATALWFIVKLFTFSYQSKLGVESYLD